ncbi:MAG TPA: nuclear transport factor 2 family protein [Solirubrobacteraceae bacterium]|jgi:steroid delta-isomerase-like uncharacterized protein|nr:nuclear transport factor 2 family protein [Solirubrobacteraceae bacterium]
MSATSVSKLESFPDRYIAAWNQRDVSTALEVLAPEFTWIDPLFPSDMPPREAASAFFAGVWQGFPDLQIEARGGPLVDAAGGRIAQPWRMTGTHTGEGFPPGIPATGRAFDVNGTGVWQVDAEGRATVLEATYDTMTLLRQLGLA